MIMYVFYNVTTLCAAGILSVIAAAMKSVAAAAAFAAALNDNHSVFFGAANGGASFIRSTLALVLLKAIAVCWR
jgi:hypothetical protein